MATYRIVCTEQKPSGHSNQRAHIVAVGVGDDPNTAVRRFALVEKTTCTRCDRVYIRSAADAVTDNNLDSLRRCSWGT